MKKIYILILAVMVAIAPVLAEARAGGSYSSSRSFSSSRSYSSPSRSTSSYSYGSAGSKGSNTYTPSPTYKPITRSTTPATAPESRGATPATQTTPTPSYATGGTGGNVGSSNNSNGPSHTGTFLSSAGGAIVGSILANSLMNHGSGGTVINNGTGGSTPNANGGMNGGMTNIGGTPHSSSSSIFDAFGVILSLAFIILTIFFIYKLVKMFMSRGKTKEDDMEHTATYAPKYTPRYDSNVEQYHPPVVVTVTSEDKAKFKHIVSSVQIAWSNRDKRALSSHMTYEMLDYFSEIMDSNTEQGVINKVEIIGGIECDVLQVWEEHGTTYATAIMRWTAHDYTTDLNGKTIDNGNTESAREVWTFQENSFGTWVLSAVQQVED